ncbi:hypothetical protein B0H15DRAFT_956968 [Mycena belliarum]|uniref:Uncharacterized protein n=1 Tax=Mycena belliarum TaxID=1033014 RepID=A0AAD6TPJ6_9AGAR|nr:hypothetical protein B0H15DRAFT_956968 [Mycena belliae]
MPTTSSARGSASPSSSRSPSPPPRRIIDFPLDDGEAGWEDEDQQLQGLGTTTHRSRNRAREVIPVRKRKRVVASGANARATVEKRREAKTEKMSSLAADIKAWEDEREERIEELAEKYGMKAKEVRRRLLSASTFKPGRAPSLYNAKISAIMARLNEDRASGEKYNIPETKSLVKKDPSMLDDFTPDEEEEMLADIAAKRELKLHGARANNMAADADARRTVTRLTTEITALAERAGMIGFAMFSRGHIHDTSIPVMIESWGALDFFREILKKEPMDVSARLELWAVNREKGRTGGDTLLDMQRQCTDMIKTGLQIAAGKTKVNMNYENYIKAMVEAQNLALVGWPPEVEFKRMSKQSAIGPLRILRDALRCGTCHWKALRGGEKARLVSQFEDMVAKGEATKKVRKKNSKKPPADEEDTDDGGVKKRVQKKASKKRAAKEGVRSRRTRAGAEDVDDEEEGERLRRLSAPARAQRAKLLELVSRKQGVAGKGKENGGRKKRKARDAEEEDEELAKRPKKKRSKRGVDGEEEEATTNGRRKRKAREVVEESGDEARAPSKKSKVGTDSRSGVKGASKSRSGGVETSSSGSKGSSKTAERPRPKPAYKGATGSLTTLAQPPADAPGTHPATPPSPPHARAPANGDAPAGAPADEPGTDPATPPSPPRARAPANGDAPAGAPADAPGTDPTTPPSPPHARAPANGDAPAGAPADAPGTDPATPPSPPHARAPAKGDAPAGAPADAPGTDPATPPSPPHARAPANGDTVAPGLESHPVSSTAASRGASPPNGSLASASTTHSAGTITGNQVKKANVIKGRRGGPPGLRPL